MLTLAPQSDNLITWDTMTLASTGAVVNGAVVTWALKDAAGNAVAGASGSLNYVNGSSGQYQGTLAASVPLTVAATYYLEVTAVSGGVTVKRRIECVVQWPDEG